MAAQRQRRTDDREVIARAVRGCDGVLTVLVPFGVRDYSSGTAGAVLDLAEPGARLVFSCGWHITRDGKDVYSLGFRMILAFFTWLARLLRFVDIDDQVRACGRIFASDRTRRVDFARFMVHALTDDALVQKVPAIVSCKAASALAYSSTETVSLA